MLKSLFAAFFFCFALATLPANAQMADRLSEHPKLNEVLGNDVVALTRDMANRLHLNEGQFLKLLPLNRTKLEGLNSISRDYHIDAAARSARAAELEAQYEQECSRILSPSQLSQLQQDNGQPTSVPATTGNGMG